jgi:hypothetical protein
MASLNEYEFWVAAGGISALVGDKVHNRMRNYRCCGICTQ